MLIEDITFSFGPSANMPATVNNGDLLALMCSGPNSGAFYSSRNGFAILDQASSVNGSFACYWKVADGTEGGASIGPLNTGGQAVMTHAYRISGDATLAFGACFAHEGDTFTPDPPLVSTGGEVYDGIVIAGAGCGSHSGVTNAVPAGYTLGRADPDTSRSISTAHKAVSSASSEDPGAFSFSSLRTFVTGTMFVAAPVNSQGWGFLPI